MISFQKYYEIGFRAKSVITISVAFTNFTNRNFSYTCTEKWLYTFRIDDALIKGATYTLFDFLAHLNFQFSAKSSVDSMLSRLIQIEYFDLSANMDPSKILLVNFVS